MTQNEFIDSVAKYVIKYSNIYDVKVNSPIIAQAILESSFGTSELATKANNFFGIKYHKDISDKKAYSKIGFEQNKNGTYTQSDMLWCNFNSLESCVVGYFKFLFCRVGITRYNNLKGISDPIKYLETIKADGYATNLDYVSKLINIINKYNLTRYDNSIKGSDCLNIINKASTHNTSYLANRKIEYIVIHYTASTTSKDGSAINIANYFKTTPNQASADFVIDDKNIVQYNSDIKNRYTWAVGGSKYTSMSTSKGGRLYGKCTNKNSISIEICSNKKNTKTLSATDTDWYFTDSELLLASKLVQKLMSDYNIKISNVIMHHEVTGKICPNPFCVNEKALSKWNDFINICKGNSVVSNNNTATTIIQNNKMYTVQCGYFKVKENADELSKKLKKKNYTCFVKKDGIAYRVQCGSFSNESNAIILKDKLIKDGFSAIIL